MTDILPKKLINAIKRFISESNDPLSFILNYW